jgi:hypothetical protein
MHEVGPAVVRTQQLASSRSGLRVNQPCIWRENQGRGREGPLLYPDFGSSGRVREEALTSLQHIDMEAPIVTVSVTCLGQFHDEYLQHICAELLAVSLQPE